MNWPLELLRSTARTLSNLDYAVSCRNFCIFGIGLLFMSSQPYPPQGLNGTTELQLEMATAGSLYIEFGVLRV